MRLLVLCHEYPPIGTGAANALSQILPRVARLGCQVTLLTSHFGELPLCEEVDGVAVRRVRCGRRSVIAPRGDELLKFLWNTGRAAQRQAEDNRPDVVLGFFTIPSGQIARRTSLRLGIPYVVALRGSDVPGYDTKRFGGLLKWTKPWARRIWRDAAAVVANSTWLRDLAARTSPGQHFEVIPNGVNAAAFKPATSRTGGNESLRVLFVGQLVPRKGLSILLEGVSRLPHATLDVVGDGPLRAELEMEARRAGINGRVIWHGHLDQHGVAQRLSQADVFALPTDAEGMSNTVLEALAAGLPVITTKPGAADLIHTEREGLVVDRTADAFGAALRRLGAAELRRQMSCEALATAQARSWDNVAAQWTALLERCCPPARSKLLETTTV